VIILDTQHLSQLQLGTAPSSLQLQEKLERSDDKDVRITIISPYEQLRECIGEINRTSADLTAQTRHFRLLERLLDFYASWKGRILAFDQRASEILAGFTPALVRRIGPRDARIAAIVLANRGVLLTSNRRDFEQVPNLDVQDWLRD
jgi:tRNA(fMet)-specific endonuclease VapC